MTGRLAGMRRIPQRGVIAGVCAGTAEYFDWNVRLFRAILVIAFLCTGFFPFVLIYLVLWYVMDPLAPEAYSRPFSESVPQGFPSGTGGGAHASHDRPASSTDLMARFTHLEERLGNMEECVTTNEFELRRELKKLES